MMLDAHCELRRGSFLLDASVSAAGGEVVALLGPNGAGKSSVLRGLAGLSRLDHGHVRLGKRTLESTSEDVRVAADQRRIGMVFQDPLLFPHLSVVDNVAFGLREQGHRKRVSRDEAARWLDRTGLEEFAHRRPSQLSGGQRQRVAIVRALATEPDLLLLDEPTSALDVSVTAQVRTFLLRHLKSFTGVTVMVTHDPLDALVLADRVVVLDHGSVTQSGPPSEVARQPRSHHIASLMGVNLLRQEHTFTTFSPTAVTLYRQRPVSSARNVWSGRVSGLVPHGDAVRVQIEGDVRLLADVTRASVAELELADGVQVWASVKATEVTVYDV